MLSNNFVGQQQKKRRLHYRIKIYSYIAGIFILLIAGWYFLGRSPIFQIKTIAVEGLTIFSNEEFLNNLKPEIIDGRIGGALGYSNYLAWPKEFEYTHPAIVSLQVEKYFWDKKISLSIVERDRYGIWCSEERCSWFDKGGSFFGNAPNTEGYLVYRINGPWPTQGMPNILQALTVMGERNVRTKKIVFDKGRQELKVYTAAGAKIIFSTRIDPTVIFLTAYDGIIKKIGLESIDYLDLTVENRIYYQ